MHPPDGPPYLGPVAGLRNFWLCCGSSFGIAQGAGCGKYLAQWMLHGDAEINMTGFDPRRLGVFADEDYARAKAFQDYRMTPGVGFRAIVRPNVVGRLDYGYSREGGAIFAGLDFPY